jgi:hypothetical protein
MNPYLKITKVFAFLTLFFALFSTLTPGQDDSIYRLPAGTKIRLRMDDGISSNISSTNDTFTTTIVKPVVIRETIVLPVGTVIEGRIIKASAAAAGGRSGKLVIRLETLKLPEGVKRDIEGIPVEELKAPSTQTGSILSVVGGTALGAIFGAVTKTGNGALIGAGIGAGAGTGVALLKKGKEIKIKRGDEFDVELKKEVILPVEDY